MTRMLTPEEQAACLTTLSPELAHIERVNRGATPEECLTRLRALAELSRLDTESLVHFAAFVTNTGVGAAKG